MSIDTTPPQTQPRMRPCPPTHPDADQMEGWKLYDGNSSLFHCGYDGILEDRAPAPGAPMNECFYDERGVLVDENHEYAGCRGTPNEYDSKTNPWKHAFEDQGGIVNAGPAALAESIKHELDETAEQLSDWLGSTFMRVLPWALGGTVAAVLLLRARKN